MADSDSDLEFESADEGQNEQELSDLDLDEILNEDEPKNLQDKTYIPFEEPLKDPKSSEESKSELEIKNQEELKIELEIKSLEEPIKEDEKYATFEEPKKEEVNEIPNLEAKTNSDEYEPFDSQPQVEGDDEVEKMLQEMGLEDSKQNVLESKKEKSGWDDTEFSDIEEEDKKEKIPERSTKSQEEVKKPTGGGWSWSKFGSDFLTSAVSLTNQIGGGLNTVLNTVEASLGAPDPNELAVKIAKAQAEEEKVQEQDEKEKSDWDNDEAEWFTLPQLNKIASTVKIHFKNFKRKFLKISFFFREPNLYPEVWTYWKQLEKRL